MTVLELASMTWEEVRGLDEAQTVAVLPVGAIEAHGPHLPLATDVIIAQAMARNGAERLAKHGLTVVILPPFQYTAAPFAQSFPGTVTIDVDAATTMLNHVADGVGQADISILAIANAHFDPTHVDGLRQCAEQRAWPRIVFPDLTRRELAGRLTEEFRSGACHAGRYEGSIMLAAAPDQVRTDVMRGLEPNPRSLSDAIRDGKQSFVAAGGERAYFGWPADATIKEGRETIDTLGTILEEAVLAVREELDA